MALQGTWYNELGSTLTIGEIQNGNFPLTYQTAVSASACAQGVFQGLGSTNSGEAGTNIGMVVSWVNNQSNCQSVTTWCGYVSGDNNEPTIVAMWLLTAADPENPWASTLIGQDIFSQVAPTEDQIKRNLAIKRHAHL